MTKDIDLDALEHAANSITCHCETAWEREFGETTILSLIARIRELEGDTGKSAEAEPHEYLTEDDFAALFRFNEVCEDSDADGHDVPKPAMKRLEQIGVVRSVGFGRHEMTAFGQFVIEYTFMQKPALPLRTNRDWSDIAAISAGRAAPEGEDLNWQLREGDPFKGGKP